MAGPPAHRMLSPQELSKRQVVAVGHLEVPAELAGLLRAVAGARAWTGRCGQGGGARPLTASSTHRPQDGPGAPGGPRADSPASG